MKIHIRLSTEERNMFRAASAEVASWPAWKLGLETCTEPRCEREVGHAGKHRRSRVEFDEWE